MPEIDMPQKNETASAVSALQRHNLPVREWFFKLRALIALVLLPAIFASLSPAFLTTGNLLILATHVAINAILATGMTCVILTGGIDLSVGSIVGLAAMIAGGLINQGLVLPMFGVVVYFKVWLIILITLVAGMLIGSLNGWLITRFRVAPFIATLGIMYVARGFALLRSNGATFPNLVGDAELGNTGFQHPGSGSVISPDSTARRGNSPPCRRRLSARANLRRCIRTGGLMILTRLPPKAFIPERKA